MAAGEQFWCFEPYSLQNFEYILFPVGVLATFCTLISIVTRIYRFFYLYFLRQCFPPRKEYGDWAVVTGGSSGIGRSYAFEFAKKGMNIVLISNEPEALQNTAEEIEHSHSVKCCYINADLSESQVYQRLREELNGKNIGVLVSNAGVAGKLPCHFLQETVENMLIMIGLHIGAVVNLTNMVLPTMLKKNRGAVITVSSFSSLNPMPRLSIYSSCKAFSDRFTRGIAYEYSDKEVHIQSLVPSYVSTRLIKFLSVKILVPSSEEFVKCAIKTLGVSGYTTGYWFHEMMSFWLPFFPTTVWKHFILKTVLRIKKHFKL